MIAVDVTIGVAITFAEFASVTATVRVFVFPFCGEEAVVTPVAIVISHVLKAARCASAAVRVIVAIAPPEPDEAAVKVVLPQPTL